MLVFFASLRRPTALRLAALLTSFGASAQYLTLPSLQPRRNQVDALPQTPVSVLFSEEMPNTPLTRQAVRVGGPQRGGWMFADQGGVATVSNRSVAFDPTADFLPGETVSVTVLANVPSTTGLVLPRGQVYQFTVATADTGTGKQLLQPPPGYSVGSYVFPTKLVVGDLDGDGDLDALTANLNDSSVSVLFNNGEGRFGDRLTVRVASRPVDLAVGDVDGDGDLDLLTCHELTNTVTVCRNDGNRTWTQLPRVSVGIKPQRLGLGDMDADGDLDLVGASIYGPVSVCFNNGAGTFSGPTQASMGAGEVGDVALGDVDADGDLDVLACLRTAAEIRVLLNHGPNPALQAYPLPADATQPLRVQGCGRSQPLTVFDLQGRPVLQMWVDVRGIATIWPRLAPGLYVARAADGRTTRLVVVE